MKYYNMDFQSAVTELLNFNGYDINKINVSENAISANNNVQEEHNPFPNELTDDKSRVTSYLNETRVFQIKR